MRDLQPRTEDLGEKAGRLGANLLDAALGAQAVADAGNNLIQDVLAKGGPAFQAMGNAAIDALNPLQGIIDKLAGINQQITPPTGAAFLFGGAETGGTPTAGYDGMTNSIARMADRLKKAKVEVGGTSGAGGSGGGLSGAIQAMNPRLRAQIDLVKELTSKVGDAGKALQSARDDMNAWISTMAGNITSGINLGAAFDQMDDVNEAGEKIGLSLIDGFNKQIEQAGIFGGYLKQLNSEGGPELRDAVAALGPEAGNKLAKEIIDKGLIKTMQSKLVDVQSMAETTAAEMVPPMLVAGVQSAAGYLMMMQAELDESSALLAEMGRKMGATLTEAMVKEIRDALAAAGFAQAGASAIMAGTAAPSSAAMAQAQAIAGNPLMNSTAIMQAIQNAIQQSDQRLGRTGQVLNA